MVDFVSAKVSRFEKGLLADLTLEGTVRRMVLFVLFQVGHIGERLAAYVALIRTFVVMQALLVLL